MTEDQMMRNVRCMEHMFPAFIEHYKRSAMHGNVQTWAKAIQSVIDLIAQESSDAVKPESE